MVLFLIIAKSFSQFPPTSSRLHPLQVENCDSNSRLVVDGDDNGNFRLDRVNDVSLTDQITVIGNEITVFKICKFIVSIKHVIISNFQPLEVDRGSETQPQVVENLNKLARQDRDLCFRHMTILV